MTNHNSNSAMSTPQHTAAGAGMPGGGGGSAAAGRPTPKLNLVPTLSTESIR